MSETRLDRALRHWNDDVARAELAALRDVEKYVRWHGTPVKTSDPKCATKMMDEYGKNKRRLMAALARLDAIRAEAGGR